MSQAKRLSSYLLLLALFSVQLVTQAHAIEHALEHHDHSCAMYLAGQESGQATHAHAGWLPLDGQSDFISVSKVLPVFEQEFAAYISRAPPTPFLSLNFAKTVF